jgi:hypothetical protein
MNNQRIVCCTILLLNLSGCSKLLLNESATEISTITNMDQIEYTVTPEITQMVKTNISTPTDTVYQSALYPQLSWNRLGTKSRLIVVPGNPTLTGEEYLAPILFDAYQVNELSAEIDNYLQLNNWRPVGGYLIEPVYYSDLYMRFIAVGTREIKEKNYYYLVIWISEVAIYSKK